MSTQPQTKGPRPDEQQAPNPPSRPNGQRGEESAAQITEHVRDASVDATDAVQEIVRQSQDGVVRSIRMWSEMMARTNPIGLFLQRTDDQVLPMRAAVDGAFEVVETLLATQRRYVDQLLATQHHLAGQLVDTVASVVAATRDEVTHNDDVEDRVATGGAGR